MPQENPLIFIATFTMLDDAELTAFKPTIVFADRQNQVTAKRQET